MNFFGYQTPKGTKTGEQGHGPDGSTPEPTREEKVTVCRAVVNTLYDDQTWTNTPECNKTLTDALCRLYAAHGDNDSGVWIVADESIIKLVKLFTPRFGHLFGTTLAQLITGKPPMGLTGTRSLKSALIRFSEVCHLIFPKFIREMAQKGVIEDIFGRILSTADDVLLVHTLSSSSQIFHDLMFYITYLQEALSQNIGKIYKTFGCYFTDEQADKLEGLFLHLLSNQSCKNTNNLLFIGHINFYSPSIFL